MDTTRPHSDAGTGGHASKVFFQQGCPVCGRRLEIDVNLLGRRVYCQHCGGGFVALDPSLVDRSGPQSAPSRSRVDSLLERAASLLDQAASELHAR